MSRRFAELACAALGAGAVAAVAPSAYAVDHLVLLPSPVRAPTSIPPLTSRATVDEVRWPGRISSSQRVEARLGAGGRPVSVTVVQRLLVRGLGDYVLAIRAPVTAVRSAAGTASEPGLRAGALLWQGFSPGRELLAVRADLRVTQAAPYLPLDVSLRRIGGASRVRLVNTTGVAMKVPAGVGRPRELAAILAAVARGQRDVFAHIAAPIGSRTVRVEAPLRVEGEIVSDSRRVPVDVVLGGGRPLEATYDVPGSAPRVRLTATPFVPAELLRLPAGVGGRGALERTVETLARTARVAQYSAFLGNPDPLGRSEAIYVFRTTSERAAPPTRGDGEDGLGALGIALIVVGAAAALVGGAVVWARS